MLNKNNSCLEKDSGICLPIEFFVAGSCFFGYLCLEKKMPGLF